MIQICQKNKERVLDAIRSGHIDASDMSFPNLIDSIVLAMKHHGFLSDLINFLEDKRRDNSHIPFEILIILAIVAKLKLKTSLTDVPFAVNDAELLAELGWNVWDNECDINDGLFSEGVMRKFLAKYTSNEWVDFCNHYVQESLIKTLGVRPSIHILDCTRIPVNLNNGNYEESSVVKIERETIRVYKLGVLRGLLDDSGIAEEIVFDTLKTYDMEQCPDLLKNPGNPAGKGSGAAMGKWESKDGCSYQCLCSP